MAFGASGLPATNTTHGYMIKARLAWGPASSRRRLLRALVLGIAVSGAVTGLTRIGAFSGWETRAVDAFLFFRERIASREIVLVLIDDDAFRDLGERQPLPRNYLADLGEILLRSGARVVAFDILFRSRSDPAEDQALIAMARRWEAQDGRRVVFASLALPRVGAQPAHYEASSTFSPSLQGLSGFANALVGSDGTIRRLAPVLPAPDGGFLPSFALAVVAGYGGHTSETLAQALGPTARDSLLFPARGADRKILQDQPISLKVLSGASWRIDFIGPPGSFTSFRSGPLVRAARSGVTSTQDNPFRDRIVLVGAAFQESREFYPTSVGLMTGVEVHANMVHTLLARRALLPPPWLLNFGVLAGTCLAVALCSLWLRPLWVFLLSLPLVAGFVIFSYEAYTRGGYWLDFVAPLVGMTSYLEGSRLLARRQLRLAFGQYVGTEILNRVVREGPDIGAELRTVSVLMSDLRGFTGLCEEMPPATVLKVMNEYFTAMIEVIIAHRGMVSDFVGDGILAVYGAPVADPGHAWHAVVTALEMQGALQRLNRRWQAEGRRPLAMGIAIHTGEVFAGTVGAPRKKKYAVLGDTVNTVARIEGLNRELSTTILISGSTMAAVTDRIVTRDCGSVTLKGKAHPVEVFELLGTRNGSLVPKEARV